MAEGDYELLPQRSQPMQDSSWELEESVWQRKNNSKRRWALIGSAGLAVVLLVAISETFRWQTTCERLTTATQYPWLNTTNSLNYDHSTDLARDNLRNDTHYITSFAQAGYSVRTGRVPIVPPIIPAAHVNKSAGILPFGTVYNLTALRSALRFPVLEWQDVKTLSPNASVLDYPTQDDPTVEHFGCWSTKDRTSHRPHASFPSENLLRLDLSFTRVPNFAFLNQSNDQEYWTTFFGLSATVLPGHAHRDANPENLPIMHKSRLGSELKPEERLACFDLLYYTTSGTTAFEFENKWSPSWYTVGRHLRFTEPLMELTRGYLRRAFGLPDDERVPSIITVHVRHGDFGDICQPGHSPPCYLPLSVYRDGVEEVRRGVLTKHGVDIKHVLVASDESDPTFWEEVRSFGWAYLDHNSEATFEKYGEWYPLLIDKVALSMGLGFVGTLRSTFSVLNGDRVEDWNGGVTKLLDHYAWDPDQ
ncbi:hypothetical protein NMY22_g9222 [Coprinellus aureogranulatus]|nr:hypothetical protein NMY22_g9222 [Coprinellus aureogranulatus]